MNEPSPPNEPKAIEPVQAADIAPPAVVESSVEPGGPIGQTKSGALTARGRKLMADVQARRPEHASIEVCFRWIELDKDIAGGVLGGGLAYRFFFWMLSLLVAHGRRAWHRVALERGCGVHGCGRGPGRRGRRYGRHRSAAG